VPAADQEEALVGQIDHRRSEIDLPVEPVLNT
jgi:hypothetical protein